MNPKLSRVRDRLFGTDIGNCHREKLFLRIAVLANGGFVYGEKAQAPVIKDPHREILSIGEWILKTACAQVSRWLAEGFSVVPVAVNVSVVQFRNDNFLALVQRILNETGLPPQYLELELTESTLVVDAEKAKLVLLELAAMGVKVAIDDFGTGYSSLSYLKQFRVNKLKIDRSFIKDLPLDVDGAAITTAIISMAKHMNLNVIAEGVETQEQISFLRDRQCDQIQGYWYSKPLLPSHMERELEPSPARLLAPIRSFASVASAASA